MGGPPEIDVGEGLGEEVPEDRDLLREIAVPDPDGVLRLAAENQMLRKAVAYMADLAATGRMRDERRPDEDYAGIAALYLEAIQRYGNDVRLWLGKHGREPGGRP